MFFKIILSHFESRYSIITLFQSRYNPLSGIRLIYFINKGTMSSVSSGEDLSPATPVCTATSSASITPSLPNLPSSHLLTKISAGLSTIQLQQHLVQVQRLLAQKTGALPQPELEQKRKPEAPAEVQIETGPVLEAEPVVQPVVQPEPEPEVGIEQFSTDHTRITASQQQGKTSCCDAHCNFVFYSNLLHTLILFILVFISYIIFIHVLLLLLLQRH